MWKKQQHKNIHCYEFDKYLLVVRMHSVRIQPAHIRLVSAVRIQSVGWWSGQVLLTGSMTGHTHCNSAGHS